jgi:hypothetical protein
MNPNYSSILAAILILAAPSLTYADSMRCDGDIISPGNTEQELLVACGNPTSREGADWLYEMPGSLPLVVTISMGVITLIRDLDESDAAFGTHPLGDRP